MPGATIPPDDEQSVHFALFSLSSYVTNTAPELLTRVIVTSTNRPVATQLQYTDAEDDNVTFTLQSNVTAHGADVSITPDGVLTYTPASFFIGRDVVDVIMTEVDLIPGIEPNFVTSQVEVYVHETRVHPMLVLELNEELASGNTIQTFMGKLMCS